VYTGHQAVVADDVGVPNEVLVHQDQQQQLGQYC